MMKCSAGFLGEMESFSQFLIQCHKSLKYERWEKKQLVPFKKPQTNRCQDLLLVARVNQELYRHSDLASISGHELIMSISYNVIAAQEGTLQSATQQRSAGTVSVTVLVVEVVLTVLLLISPVVTLSSVSHSAKAAQSADWSWMRDSEQSANAATDCWETQPIL